MAKLEKDFAIKDGKVVFDAKKAEKRLPLNVQLQRKNSKKIRVKRRKG